MNSNNYNSLVKIASELYDHYDYLEQSRNSSQLNNNAKYPATKPSKTTGGIPLTKVEDVEKGINDLWNRESAWTRWFGDKRKDMKVPFIQGQGSPLGFNVLYGIKGDPRSDIERYDESAAAQRQAEDENNRSKKVIALNLDLIFRKLWHDSLERAKRGLPTTPRDAIGLHTLYMNPDGSVNKARALLDAIKSGIAKWNIAKGHPLNPAELRHLADRYKELNATVNGEIENPTEAYLTSPGNAAIEAHNANKFDPLR